MVKSQIQLLAERFTADLKDVLTPKEFGIMQSRNAKPEYQNGVCASHDFCDANMVMADSFEAVVGRPMVQDGGDSPVEQADQALWNAAWELAHRTTLRKGRTSK